MVHILYAARIARSINRFNNADRPCEEKEKEKKHSELPHTHKVYCFTRIHAHTFYTVQSRLFIYLIVKDPCIYTRMRTYVHVYAQLEIRACMPRSTNKIFVLEATHVLRYTHTHTCSHRVR